jgi:hypothetical protein
VVWHLAHRVARPVRLTLRRRARRVSMKATEDGTIWPMGRVPSPSPRNDRVLAHNEDTTFRLTQ